MAVASSGSRVRPSRRGSGQRTEGQGERLVDLTASFQPSLTPRTISGAIPPKQIERTITATRKAVEQIVSEREVTLDEAAKVLRDTGKELKLARSRFRDVSASLVASGKTTLTVAQLQRELQKTGPQAEAVSVRRERDVHTEISRGIARLVAQKEVANPSTGLTVTLDRKGSKSLSGSIRRQRKRLTGR